MAGVGYYGGRAYRLLAACLLNAGIYRSWRDVVKSVLLRVSVKKPVRQFFPRRCELLWVRNDTEPIYLRYRSSDFAVFSELFEQGCYDSAASFRLPRDPVIVDLGANVGLSIRRFVGMCPDATFLAVEPSDENLQILGNNCDRLLSEQRVTVVHAFVGARDGQAYFDGEREAWSLRKTDSPTGSPVRCLTLNSLLAEHVRTQVDLLKCDIEGAEQEVFGECGTWINMVENLIIEVHRPYSLTGLYADLKRAGWVFTVLEVRCNKVAFLQRC